MQTPDDPRAPGESAPPEFIDAFEVFAKRAQTSTAQGALEY